MQVSASSQQSAPWGSAWVPGTGKPDLWPCQLEGQRGWESKDTLELEWHSMLYKAQRFSLNYTPTLHRDFSLLYFPLNNICHKTNCLKHSNNQNELREVLCLSWQMQHFNYWQILSFSIFFLFNAVSSEQFHLLRCKYSNNSGFLQYCEETNNIMGCWMLSSLGLLSLHIKIRILANMRRLVPACGLCIMSQWAYTMHKLRFVVPGGDAQAGKDNTACFMASSERAASDWDPAA